MLLRAKLKLMFVVNRPFVNMNETLFQTERKSNETKTATVALAQMRKRSVKTQW